VTYEDSKCVLGKPQPNDSESAGPDVGHSTDPLYFHNPEQMSAALASGRSFRVAVIEI